VIQANRASAAPAEAGMVGVRRVAEVATVAPGASAVLEEAEAADHRSVSSKRPKAVPRFPRILTFTVPADLVVQVRGIRVLAAKLRTTRSCKLSNPLLAVG
jgi:hypothetical protein